MSEFGIKRLDHHGITMGVIQDLNLISLIDERVGTFEDEKLSVGTRVAAMIINGLGFTDQPLSLVPEFFEELPIEHLFGDNITSEDFNRFNLARALDRVSGYGIETLFAEVAAHACAVSGVDLKTQALDTTTFSLTGEYDDHTSEIQITHGYSKDHRPDLKQIVTELVVSHDSGVPLCIKNWSGNESDTHIFKHRAEQLCAAFENGYVNHLTADSKFYTEANSSCWDIVRFTTRVPETLTAAKDVIQQAQAEKHWSQARDAKTEYVVFNMTHYNCDQRWLVCRSAESLKRAQKAIPKLVQQERDKIDKAIFHLQAKRFKCSVDAEQASQSISKKWKYHDVFIAELKQIPKFDKPGYSKNRTPAYYEYQIILDCVKSEERILIEQQRKASFVLATNMSVEALSNDDVVKAYKDQQHVERGYRFLKDPQFFSNAFFIKTPSRISALIMVMTLALLVYSIAQKRITAAIKKQDIAFKDQSGTAKKALTVRRAFQLFRGVYTLPNAVGHQYKFIIDGLNETRVRILKLFKGRCLEYYYDARLAALDNPKMAN